MTTPVVLFTADSRDFDGYTWHCAPTTYLEAVLAVSGGMPLILSAFGPRLDLDAVLDRVSANLDERDAHIQFLQRRCEVAGFDPYVELDEQASDDTVT